MPRSARRSPRRCRKTSPRGLAMSRMPIIKPSRRSGRGRRGRIVGFRSEVGSRSTLIVTSLHSQLSFLRKAQSCPADSWQPLKLHCTDIKSFVLAQAPEAAGYQEIAVFAGAPPSPIGFGKELDSG